MKKMFTSLMLGFGAALGVFVALAMPPGGWGVAVGVGLGLLGCLPLLLVLVLLINRGQTEPRPARREYEEAAPPIVIIQQPAFNGPPQEPPYYEMYPGSQAASYGYMEAPDYYAAPLPPRTRRESRPEPRRLQPNRRRSALEQGYFRPQPEYEAQLQYDQDYYAASEYDEYNEYDYYEQSVGVPVYEQEEPEYYEPRRQPVYQAEPEPVSRVRPVRRSNLAPRRALRPEEAVEAEYRTIGDNE